MKEDKFILICMVCLIAFCRIWGMFNAPAINNKVADEKVSVTEQQVQTKKQVEKPKAKFIGCGSSFSSQNSARFINGKSSVHYVAKNTIACDCDINGKVVKKIAIYQYTSEPDHVDLDCNSKCGEICARK